jgi:hypothetical protein
MKPEPARPPTEGATSTSKAACQTPRSIDCSAPLVHAADVASVAGGTVIRPTPCMSRAGRTRVLGTVENVRCERQFTEFPSFSRGTAGNPSRETFSDRRMLAATGGVTPAKAGLSLSAATSPRSRRPVTATTRRSTAEQPFRSASIPAASRVSATPDGGANGISQVAESSGCGAASWNAPNYPACN